MKDQQQQSRTIQNIVKVVSTTILAILYLILLIVIELCVVRLSFGNFFFSIAFSLVEITCLSVLLLLMCILLYLNGSTIDIGTDKISVQNDDKSKSLSVEEVIVDDSVAVSETGSLLQDYTNYEYGSDYNDSVVKIISKTNCKEVEAEEVFYITPDITARQQE